MLIKKFQPENDRVFNPKAENKTLYKEVDHVPFLSLVVAISYPKVSKSSLLDSFQISS